jgi:quinoprotein glucose dehydrogenase
VAAAAGFLAVFISRAPAQGVTALGRAPSDTAAQDRAAYDGTVRGTRFSSLDEITPVNVASLQRAWLSRTGDLGAGRAIDALGGLKGLYGISGLQSTPIQVGEVLYTCIERDAVVALDAETGEQLWRFDPQPCTKVLTHSSCRGVSYHAQAGATGARATRILHGTLDAKLWAIDARTGLPCADFGTGVRVASRNFVTGCLIGDVTESLISIWS